MNLSILGSTGSIGVQALEVVKDKIKIDGLACLKNIGLLIRQINKFKPSRVCIVDEAAGKKFKEKYSFKKIYYGKGGLLDFIDESESDFLIAIPGSYAIEALYRIVNKKNRVFNASKEAFISIAETIEADKILPVDSEHIGVMQCIKNDFRKIRRIFISATGGPFVDRKMKNYSIKEVMAHPVWNMGRKITVDSATLINKCFEVIEASYIFNMEAENISIVLNRRGEFHGGVEFVDGNIILNFSKPDMKKVIAYALGLEISSKPHFFSTFNFEVVDEKRFPAIAIAKECLKKRGSYLPCLVAADDVAVEAFLSGKIPFTKIIHVIEKTLGLHKHRELKKFSHVMEVIEEAKYIAKRVCKI